MVTLRPIPTAPSLEEELGALAAPTSDPLWMLARQWQTGAFIADDAGTPVQVRLGHLSVPVRFAGRDLTGPLEPVVESELPPVPASLETAARVRLAAELFRRVHDAGAGGEATARLRAALASAYPLQPAGDDSRQAPLAGRLPDAAKLFVALAAVLAADGSGPFPTLPGVDPSDPDTAAKVEGATRGWFAWVHPQVSPEGTGGISPVAWNGERLEYDFEASAELPDGPVSLVSTGYDGTGADWYSFDRTVLPPGGSVGSSALVEVRPTPVTYAGMPRPRFWEMEDGDVNLDAMVGDDPAHALLRTFAHAYANDWFLVPLELPPGVTLIAGLEVTDTFGITTTIAATAALDGPTSPWALWDLTAVPTGSGQDGDAAAGLRVLLPCSPPPLESLNLEDVVVARDEMANLAWIIELTTRDQDGATVDRYRRWLSLRSASPASDPATRDGAADYRLGTTLPDYWYPLVAGEGPAGRRLLEVAGLPDGVTDVSDAGVQGHLISHAPGTTLGDEEASRTGTRLTRLDRLIRTVNGPVVWRARTCRPGMGEASSGLRFDVLR